MSYEGKQSKVRAKGDGATIGEGRPRRRHWLNRDWRAVKDFSLEMSAASAVRGNNCKKALIDVQTGSTRTSFRQLFIGRYDFQAKFCW